MGKLTEIVISLWLEIIKLDEEWFNVILLCGTILEYHIWNKWKCMSVNKWLTWISYKCMKKGSSQQQWTRQISIINLIQLTLMIVKQCKTRVFYIKIIRKYGCLWVRIVFYFSKKVRLFSQNDVLFLFYFLINPTMTTGLIHFDPVENFCTCATAQEVQLRQI